MTEPDWNGCNDPQAMLAFLRESGKLTNRKARLFAAACCRRVWHLLADERSRRAVEVTERFVEGTATEEELEAARSDAWELTLHTVHENEAFFDLSTEALNAADVPAWAAEETVDPLRVVVAAQRALGTAEGKAQADVIRCILGNPFRPPSAITAAILCWNDGLIRRLAEEAYQQRIMPVGHLDPQRLAVLADALEEAGTDAGVVAHLRANGPHYRGCWPVDLLMGRE